MTTDSITQFRLAMSNYGLVLDGEIIDDGKLHRFTVAGDKYRSNNGWYVFYSDGIQSGSFGCWKRNISESWCSKKSSDMTPDEFRKYNERIEQARADRDLEIKKRHFAASEHAKIIWDSASECISHEYLTKKGIAANGARVGRWTKANEDTGEIWLDVDNALLVPVMDGKKIAGLQAIFAEKIEKIGRNKDFLSGAKKRGCYYPIGSPSKESDLIIICEGFATGASIYECTGYPVLVAFDAGNLASVADVARRRAPSSRIFICADDDRETKAPLNNPGVTMAIAACNSENKARVIVPKFKDLTRCPTDFNDLHALEGAEEVKRQILDAVCGGKEIAETADIDTKRVKIDYFSPLPEINSRGKPIATIENFKEITVRLGVNIRYNVISKDIEILIPDEEFSLDNRGNASLAWLSSWCTRFGMGTSNMCDYITYLADKNQYNPVATWIESKPWDGKKRAIYFFDTVKAAGEEADERIKNSKRAMMARWMISAVAAAFLPNGVSAHGVLVFQGDQYLGKTKWFKSLVPSDLGVIADGLMLKPDDKDSVKQAVSNWLVELGELDSTFRKADIAQLKSFLTRDKDVIRRAYARLESCYARRTVFFASVNPREFLHDQTGNRRYWTIECESIDHSHDFDMQQVWAEIHHLFKSGESWFLTPEELSDLNDKNKDFEVVDPVAERIKSALAWDSDQSLWQWLSATDALISAGFDKPTQAEATRAANVIRSLNGNLGKRSNGSRVLLTPPKLFTRGG